MNHGGNMSNMDNQVIPSTEPLNRQQDLDQIVTDALRDPDLVEAMQAFEMSEQEYVRAMTSSTVITFYSGDSSNLEGNANADLDSDQG
jgi:hypothetical protein